MTSKSCKPAPCPNPRAVGQFPAVLLLLLLAAGARLHAQASAPSSGPPKPKSAYVRFWNMLPANQANGGELQLFVTEPNPLTVAPPGNYYAGYQPLTPAGYVFTVRRSSDNPANPLRRLPPANLRADTYVTILAFEKDGHPTVELIDDTPDPKAPADTPGKIVVRQFIPGARVTVVADRRVTSGELVYGDAHALDNLPTRAVPLTMQSTPARPGTPPRSWNTEVDFSGSARRATLLVVADPYGRFRPRLAFDGPGPEAPEPAAPNGPAMPNPAGRP